MSVPVDDAGSCCSGSVGLWRRRGDGTGGRSRCEDGRGRDGSRRRRTRRCLSRSDDDGFLDECRGWRSFGFPFSLVRDKDRLILVIFV